MFNLALKNILFYKSRSITTFLLTFFAAFLFIIYVGMVDGSHKTMLENALNIYTGDIEIYKKGYRDIGGSEYLIKDVTEIEKKLDTLNEVKAYTSRYETFGLLSYKEYSTATMLAGIQPETETQLSKLKEAKVEGQYLSSDAANCIYIGEPLLQKLHAQNGDSLSFIGSASDNSFVAELFKVCGVFKTGLFAFDSSSSFVNRNYFDGLFYSKNMASYIVVDLKNLDTVQNTTKKIQTLLGDEYEVLSWRDLMKAMVEAMKVDSIFAYISISVFFVVIFFVIMIFSFINVSSRIKEFGILRAIGLKPKNITSLLFWEMFILCTTAIILAIPLSGSVVYYYTMHPITFQGISETYKQYGIVSDQVTFNFDLFTIGWNAAVIYLIDFLSIIYPIVYVNGFKPVEAIRHV
jgi:ABC-type lipoprotein release transport system permease subunit